MKVDALTRDGSIRTIVSVVREQNFTRSGPEVADEVLFIFYRVFLHELFYFFKMID